MKRFLASFLVLTMMISLAVPGLSFMVSAEEIAGVSVVGEQIDTAPDFTAAITEEAWGTPAVTFDKDTDNTVKFDYNATCEDVSADLYLRWDSTYLYVGMASADADLAGSADSWVGDGIQFKVGKGETMPDTALNIYVTLDADAAGVTAGGGGDSGYEKNIVVADGKLNVMVAVPFADLGITAAEIEGTVLSMSVLRISGTSEAPYAGWVSWGAFFGADHANNPGLTADNTVVLKDSDKAEGALPADKITAAPDFNSAVTEEAWGKPVMSIADGEGNAAAYAYEGGTPDADMTADMYFRWDASNLYVAMVTADADIKGDDATYKGDGIQLRINAGPAMGDFIDVYVTLAGDNTSVQADHNDKIGEYPHNIVIEDGKLNVMLAIPFEALGVTAAEGEVFAFNFLRISGANGNGYAGWLACGPFFSVGHDYNPGLTVTNKLILTKPALVDPVVTGDAYAEQIGTAPDFNSAITEEAWGKPAVSFDKDTDNTVKFDYNATCEDASADLYLRWDATYLYVGMVSEDADLAGSADSWVGDGIQFKVGKGKTMPGDALNIYVTLDADASSITAGGGGDSGYEKNIVVADGKLNVMVAVPFADLGLTEADLNDGTVLSMSALRISGTSEHPYAGWVSWGAFFGADHANNPGVMEDNTVVLKSSKAVDAYLTETAPDFNSAITEEAWGKPAVSFDKDTDNTVKFDYNATCEDVSADLYLRWDSTYLYVGMVSEDADLAGSADSWVGDGIQFKVSSGANMDDANLNIYVSLDADASSITAGGGGDSGYEKNIVVADGKLNVMVAVPFADLGLTEADLVSGKLLTMSVLRISGTSEHPYAGWVSWGAFFGADHANNPGVFENNMVVLKYAEAVEEEPGLVDPVVTGDAYAEQIGTAPDFNSAITEEAWGKPAVSFDKDTDNTVKFDYNATCEDVSADLYLRWDSTYLYVGMASADADLAGSADSWVGDGIQFKVGKGETMPEDALNIYVTLDADAAGVTAGGGGDSGYEKNIVVADGKINVMVAVPFADLGLAEADLNDGTVLSMSALRISGTSDHAYAGWVSWGAFFGADHANNPGVMEDNTVVLKSSKAVDAILTDKAPDFNSAITEEAWGKPAVSFDKDTDNTVKFDYNATCEDVSADLYLRWDATYLYVGMVSEDADLAGSADSWVGDGIQFKVSSGANMDDANLNIYVTLDADAAGITAGGGGDSGYEKNIVVADGKLNVMVAVPFADLGLTEADLVSGKLLTMSVLRISGTSDHAYAGWVSWGAFFGADHANNPGVFENNMVVLKYAEKVEEEPEFVLPEGAVQSVLTDTAPDFNSAVTEEVWGKPAVSFDKDTDNTVKFDYNATCEDVSADLYLRWDSTYLYVGMVSEDADLAGSADSWVGDGIQFKVGKGETMPEDALNIYVTLDADAAGVTAGGGGDSGYEKNIVVADGKLNVMVAVPFADLGLTEADLVEGTALAMSVLRISGTSEHSYAGWLAWGAFFGADHANNPGVTEDNTVILVNSYIKPALKIPAGTLQGIAIDTAPDFNSAVTEEAWGKPAVSIADGKNNAALFGYNGAVAENVPADLYFRWDATKLYVAMVTPDSDLRGDAETYIGDGIQFRINAGDSIDGFADVYVTLDGSNATAHAGHNDRITDLESNIVYADGKLNIMFAISFADLGVTPEEGTQFAVNALRISGTADAAYAGWLAWGPFFSVGHEYNPGLTETNKLVLVNSYIEPEAHVHTEVTLEAVAPTCTETGLTEGKKCSVCGEILVAQETVEALGHTEETIAAVAPTCTETGLTEGKKCTVCGEITVAQETVAALGHTEETIAAVAPTCTETGLTEGKKCTVCGEITVAQETVEALGHDFADEFTVDVEPTYEADGSKSRHCSRCDEKTDVTVIPKLVNSADIFKDVKKSSWFKDAVDYAVYNGLMNGKTADTFAPNEATTRAQLVTVLWRLEGEPVVDVDVPFTDLKQDWYKDAVAWAFANGIVNGKTATTFAPNGNITREEIAAILYRYANFKGFDVTESKDLDFTDAGRVHDYAVDAMKWAYAEELITGSNEGGKLLLAPRGNATRAQIATLLMRFCENIAK